jgi:nucleoside phosphorylase
VPLPPWPTRLGITGGLAKAGVSIGDVLISEQIADYEVQKVTSDKAHIRWSVHPADPRLLAAAKQLPQRAEKRAQRYYRA